MKDIIKALDNLPFIVKLILCIPALDIVWLVYRLLRSIDAKNTLGIVLCIVVFIVGIPFVWLFDLLYLLIKKEIWWIC